MLKYYADVKRTKATLVKWLYYKVESLYYWLGNKANSHSLCPYGTECKICGICGRCRWHGEPCWGKEPNEQDETVLATTDQV